MSAGERGREREGERIIHRIKKTKSTNPPPHPLVVLP